MKYIVVTLTMVALLGAVNVKKIDVPAVMERSEIIGTPVLKSMFRSDQPDTLLYDDGSPA